MITLERLFDRIGVNVIALEQFHDFNSDSVNFAKTMFKKHGHMLLLDTLYRMHQESKDVFNEKFSAYLFKYTKMAIVYVSNNSQQEADLMKGTADAVERFGGGVENVVRLPQTGAGGPYVLCFSSKDADTKAVEVEQRIVEAVLNSFVLMKLCIENSRLGKMVELETQA